MKDFLKEIIRLWWVEAGTELKNPKSEVAIKALKTILREDFELDSEFIDYIVESVNKTPTNFVLHGDHDSGIKVGKNQTAVSAKIHPDYDEEETEDDGELNEDSAYTAINIASGLKTDFKSQENKDAGIAAGTHTELDGSVPEKEETPPTAEPATKADTIGKDFANGRTGAEKDTSTTNTPSAEEIIKSFSGEMGEILSGDKSPPGTGGSAVGEMYGSVAVEDFYESELSEDDFIGKNYNEVRDSPISKGMTEVGIKDWLKVAYKTGRSEVGELRSNEKYRFKNPQSKPYPIGVMDPVNNSGSAKAKLIDVFKQKIIEATSGNDKKAITHYKRQLNFIQKRKDTDTGILYETTEGYIGFKHTSNKKKFGDPVFNTTVNQRGKVMKSILPIIADEYNLSEVKSNEIIGSIDTIIQTAAGNIKLASKGPSGTVQGNVSDSFEFSKKHKLGNQFKNFGAGSKGRTNYLAKIKEEISNNAGIGKKVIKVLEGAGIQPPYSDDDIAGAVIDVSKAGDTTTSVNKMIVKLSDNVKLAREVHSRIRDKNPTLSDDEIKQKTLETLNGYKNSDSTPFDSDSLNALLSPELDWVLPIGDGSRDAMTQAHTQIVTDLDISDKKYQKENAPNPPQPPLNGPHKQAYIESYMKQMHWDRYIMGEEEDIGDMNVDGKTVNSKMIRNCISNLSGYSGDLDSIDGKKQLMAHLRKTMQMSSKNQSLTFNNNENGKVIEIGSEQYRTKGVGVNSLLGNFGKDLQKCLKNG